MKKKMLKFIEKVLVIMVIFLSIPFFVLRTCWKIGQILLAIGMFLGIVYPLTLLRGFWFSFPFIWMGLFFSLAAILVNWKPEKYYKILQKFFKI